MPALTTSRIFINDIILHAQHGVLPQEQLTGNDYKVSVSLDYDISKAINTDNVADTINYAEVYEVIKEEMITPSKLIEHVAGRIAQRLLTQYPSVAAITLSITKLNPPMGAQCQGAGVEITMCNKKLIKIV